MYRQFRRSLAACAVMLVGALSLSACAPTVEPVVNGVKLVTAPIALDSQQSTPRSAPPELASLNVMPVRLRNDATKFAARVDYIPGANKYNMWLNAKMWKDVQSTGVAYKPQAQASGAGFIDRGCVPGSSKWPAAQVLSTPATGPTGGGGIAIVCDVTDAYGSQIEMTIRTVAGSPSAITRDETIVKIVNAATDEMFDPTERWSDQNVSALWGSVVELLKRKSGEKASTDLESPTPEQALIVKKALSAARDTSTGELLISLPAGITSPQLSQQGIAPTSLATDVTIEPQAVRGWTAPAYYNVQNDRSKVFAGSEKPLSDVAIDCALVPCVAMTYDDGPTTYSPQLLDVLKSLRVNATFYMIGLNIVKYPDLVKRAFSEGHELGSHTMDHKELTKLTVVDARDQVIAAADAITKITGKPVTTFRAPYGSVNQTIINAIGLPAMNWNVDPGDWNTPGQPALISRTVPVAKADSIILMHEIRLDSIQVAKTIITGLRDRGLEPVTVSQLFSNKIPIENLREVKRG